MTNFAKVALAGATIGAIGVAMVTLQPNSTVKQADADILALDFAPQSKTEKFVGSLQALGMEEPRVYDWNGNKMFFSTMETDRSPKQVLGDFQRQFVQDGVNKHAFTSMPEAAATYGHPSTWKNLSAQDRKAADEAWGDYINRGSEFFGGGMIPTVISSGYVAMGGMESKNGARSGIEFLKEVYQRKSRNLTDSVGIARYIEAFSDGGRTRVTATWTQENVDFKKFRNIGDNIGFTDKIPACPTCERMMRFKGESEDAYANNYYQADLSVEQVVAFYEQSLTARGWRVSPATQAVRNAEKQGWKPESDAELVSFARGGEFITLLVNPQADGKTSVQVVESP